MKDILAGRTPRWVAALIALLAVVAVTITVTDQDDNGRPDTITIRIDTADPDRRADDQMRIPAPAIEQAAESDVNEHDGLKSEVPVGVPAEQVAAGQDQQDRLAQSDQLPIVTPLAAPSQRGCRTRIVQNSSSRRGVRPRLLVAHYTVSSNRPGWSDVDAITALFDRPSFQASSHYVIDREGHCNYIVRESDKAWTQAGYNPLSISVEIINSGRERTLMDDAGYRKLGQVFADAARRWQIPLRPGRVSGCTVARSGIVQHADLGACGGGHHDVGPYPMGPVIKAAQAAAARDACRATCRRRREHAQLHQRLEQLQCRHRAARTRHPNACRRLNERNRALHRQGL